MTGGTTAKERRAVGRIVRPVGLRGEVKVVPLTDAPERVRKLKKAWVGRSADQAEPVRIEQARIQGNALVMKFEAVGTVEAAEQCREQFLFIEEEPCAERSQRGSYLIDDIIGCAVVTAAGEAVGTVEDVLSLPANDVWVVRNGTKEYLLPAVRALLRSVDVGRKRIEVEDLEGLFE
jgi:16S rRNA processing protein RimM